jgi:hypothetical protein
MRGTPELDFRQLFLVKESLALMYQMMQLPTESLVQYEELEALLVFAGPLAPLPNSEWPLIPVDLGTSLSKKSSKTKAGDDNILAQENPPQSEIDSSIPSSPLWMNAYHQGQSVLMYSINHSRMKVLKNKISIIELTHYVFARQTYFLFLLGRISVCAEKGLKFMTGMYSTLSKKLDEVQRGTAIDDLKNAVLDRNRGSQSPSGLPRPVALTGESDPKNKLKDISVMIGVWAVVSAIQIVRGCREHIHTALAASSTPADAVDSSNSPGFSRTRSVSGASVATVAPAAPPVNMLDISPGQAQTATQPANIPAGIHESIASKIRNTSRYLSDLLFFAKEILLIIFQYQQAIQLSLLPSLSVVSETEMQYDIYRQLSVHLARDFFGWSQFDQLIEKYPSIFLKAPSQSDDDLLPSILTGPTSGKEPDTPEKFKSRENGSKQKLFSESIENVEEVTHLSIYQLILF